jgi:hypothetical protein
MNKTTPATTHGCNFPGCDRQIRREHWACDAHWWVIPLSQRNRLSRAWQALKAVRTATAAAPAVARAAIAEYRAAEADIIKFAKGGKSASR